MDNLSFAAVFEEIFINLHLKQQMKFGAGKKLMQVEPNIKKKLKKYKL